MEKLTHISASQLATYQRCGEQYRRRYIEGEVIPPKVSMVSGTAVHKARSTNLAQKITTKLDLPQEQVIQASRDSLDLSFQGEILLDAEDLSIKQAKDGAIDKAARMTACDYDVFQRTITPTHVEEQIKVEVPGLGRDIVGILDTADSDRVVRDLKTMAKTPPEDAAEKSDQLTTYALLYKTQTGHLPEHVQLDSVIDLKSGTKGVARVAMRSDEDLDMILRRYFAAIQAIDKGVFVPAPSDSWQCSAKYCGYSMSCPYFRRGDSRPEN